MANDTMDSVADEMVSRQQRVLRLRQFPTCVLEGDPLLHFGDCEINLDWCLGSKQLQSCFELVQKTSGGHYRASSIRWNPAKKLAEMEHVEMYYLLVRKADWHRTPVLSSNLLPDAGGAEYFASLPDPRILGFLSFKFEKDDPPHQDRDVLYIYEIHLQKDLRGLGLGTHLIKIAETVARRCHILKVMLTVFTANTAAHKLYHRLGYKKDPCSPSGRVVRGKTVDPDYIIMGKYLEPISEFRLLT